MEGTTQERDRTGGGRQATPSSCPRGIPARSIFRIVALLLAVLIARTADAAGSTITVSVVVQSKSICKFRSNAAALDFGMLDPGNPVDVTRVTSLEFRCMGNAPIATYGVSDDDGMHETGTDANRMMHRLVPGEYLPYSLTVTPDSGAVPKGEFRMLTVSGTVRGPDYLSSLPGSYSDTVVVTINP